MNEDQSFSTSLKIAVIIILFILVVATIFIYSKKISTDLKETKEKNNSIQQTNDSVHLDSPSEIIVDQEKLISDYQSGLKSILFQFNGDYQNLQSQIVDLVVPSGFQDLHLQLVLAFNPVIYNNNPSLTQKKLEEIALDYDWLKLTLEKLILDLNKNL